MCTVRSEFLIHGRLETLLDEYGQTTAATDCYKIFKSSSGLRLTASGLSKHPLDWVGRREMGMVRQFTLGYKMSNINFIVKNTRAHKQIGKIYYLQRIRNERERCTRTGYAGGTKTLLKFSSATRLDDSNS